MQPQTVKPYSNQVIRRSLTSTLCRHYRMHETKKMKAKRWNDHNSRFCLTVKRVILIVCVSIQIGVVKAQSTVDSNKTADTSVSLSVRNDTIASRTVVRKPVKVIHDTAIVFYTDTLRFSTTKPPDYDRLAIDWSDLLKIQPF